MELISGAEKAYKHRKLILSRRFGPTIIPAILLYFFIYFVLGSGSKPTAYVFLTLATLLSILVTRQGWPWEVFWIKQLNKLIDDCDIDSAKSCIKCFPELMTQAAKIKLSQAKYHLAIQENNNLEAFMALQNLGGVYLTSKERERVNISIASIKLYDGNLSGFLADYFDIEAKQADKNSFYFLLLKANFHEQQNNLPDATIAFERALESQATEHQKIAALNNLARLERIQGNLNNAQGYLERAQKKLEKNPCFYLYFCVMENLVWNQIDLGNPIQVTQHLDSFWEKINKNNPSHVIEYLNLKTNVARQSKNPDLLKDAYTQAELLLKPLLHEDSLLPYMVANFTMRFNDGYQFLELLDEVHKNIILINTRLTDEHKFLALSDIIITLRKYLRAYPNDNNTQKLFLSIYKELTNLERVPDEKLRDIPPGLPGTRDFWHTRKTLLLELKIHFSQTTKVPKKDIEKLFQGISERGKIWNNKGNPYQEISVFLECCEQYIKYKQKLGQNFYADYRDLAINWLAQADEILTELRQKPTTLNLEHYAIGMAFFYWQILGDYQKSSLWVKNFEQTQVSPLHFASGLQQQLYGTKQWLNSISNGNS